MANLNLTAAEKRVEELTERLKQAKNQARLLAAKETAKQREQERKERDRRLIITGAVMWNLAQADDAFKAKLLQWLDDGIPDNRNRVLFGLAERPERANNAGKSLPASAGGTGGGSG